MHTENATALSTRKAMAAATARAIAASAPIRKPRVADTRSAGPLGTGVVRGDGVLAPAISPPR